MAKVPVSQNFNLSRISRLSSSTPSRSLDFLLKAESLRLAEEVEVSPSRRVLDLQLVTPGVTPATKCFKFYTAVRVDCVGVRSALLHVSVFCYHGAILTETPMSLTAS